MPNAGVYIGIGDSSRDYIVILLLRSEDYFNEKLFSEDRFITELKYLLLMGKKFAYPEDESFARKFWLH